MDVKGKAGNLLPMTVCEGVTVNVLPHKVHEYLMTTREVAKGYEASLYAVRKALLRNSDELIEGKHFIKGVDILSSPSPGGVIQQNSILLTKRGIIRLGYCIKSEKAKRFRDWAEDLVIKVEELAQAGAIPVVPQKELPRKRNHNRLTSDRLIRLLTLAHRISDAGLRNEIVEQLMGAH